MIVDDLKAFFRQILTEGQRRRVTHLWQVLDRLAEDVLSKDNISGSLTADENNTITLDGDADPTGAKYYGSDSAGTKGFHDLPGFSVIGAGSLESDGTTVNLKNDNPDPGNLFYYGTNDLGVQGWHLLPETPVITEVPGTAGSLELSGGNLQLKGDVTPMAGQYYGTNELSEPGYYTLPTAPGTEMSVDLVAGNLRLKNDAETPGSDMFYGTDVTGAKGWQTIAASTDTNTDVIVISLDQEALRGASDSVFLSRADLPVLLPNYAGRIVAAKAWFKNTYTGATKPVLKLHFGTPGTPATNDLTIATDSTMYTFVLTANVNFSAMASLEMSCAGGGNLDSGVGVIYLFVEKN